MSSLQFFHATSFREGRWRNGLGVSWDIASDSSGDDFGWRMAIARIDGDVPFSHYQDIDRVFTLIEGAGLDLTVAGHGTLAVADCFVPTAFPGDAETYCRLRGGACRALNLFTRRGLYTAEVAVRKIAGSQTVGHGGLSLCYALDGEVRLDGARLQTGDAALLSGEALASAAAPEALFYEARLAVSAR